jgi:hypothetical protein
MLLLLRLVCSRKLSQQTISEPGKKKEKKNEEEIQLSDRRETAAAARK